MRADLQLAKQKASQARCRQCYMSGPSTALLVAGYCTGQAACASGERQRTEGRAAGRRASRLPRLPPGARPARLRTLLAASAALLAHIHPETLPMVLVVLCWLHSGFC